MTNSDRPSDNAKSVTSLFSSPEWYVKGYAANIRVRTESIGQIATNERCERILDIGCGDGSLSLPLLPRAKHVTFLDLSPAMLEIVAKRVGRPEDTEVNYVNTDFLQASLPEKGYDFIICVGVLAYVENTEAFLAKVGSVLKPGGVLVLECTDTAHFLSKLQSAYIWLLSAVRTAKYSIYPKKARDVLADAKTQGLILEKSFRYAYSLPLLSRFLSQPNSYRLIRSTYGDISSNKYSGLGNQCIFSFRYPKH